MSDLRLPASGSWAKRDASVWGRAPALTGLEVLPVEHLVCVSEVERSDAWRVGTAVIQPISGEFTVLQEPCDPVCLLGGVLGIHMESAVAVTGSTCPHPARTQVGLEDGTVFVDLGPESFRHAEAFGEVAGFAGLLIMHGAELSCVDILRAGENPADLEG